MLSLNNHCATRQDQKAKTVTTNRDTTHHILARASIWLVLLFGTSIGASIEKIYASKLGLKASICSNDVYRDVQHNVL